MTAGWHALAVDLARETDMGEKHRKLRRLEAWLAEHHRPTRLFHPDGRTIGDTVCLAVPLEDAAKALAFRALCNELDLAGRVAQWRIANRSGQHGEATQPDRRLDASPSGPAPSDFRLRNRSFGLTVHKGAPTEPPSQ